MFRFLDAIGKTFWSSTRIGATRIQNYGSGFAIGYGLTRPSYRRSVHAVPGKDGGGNVMRAIVKYNGDVFVRPGL
jgi:hypothetical protein